MAFLKANRNIGGKNQELSINNLKEATNFYSDKLTSLKLKEIKINKKLNELNKLKNDLNRQMYTLTSKKEFSNGEILVKVDAKSNMNVKFEISYLVGNSGWFPSYDIRAKNVNEPIELIYKANIKQDTKVDWNNIKLKLSSANPSLSGVAPELKTYYLNYNTLPPTYKNATNLVTGKIFDENHLPLPGSTVVVKGTTIGTSADFDGNYSISIPNNSSQLEYSFIGYETKTLPITGSTMNVYLTESFNDLEEVVIVGYGSKRKKSFSPALEGKVSGLKIRGNSSLQLPVKQIEKQTTVNFEIKTL